MTYTVAKLDDFSLDSLNREEQTVYEQLATEAKNIQSDADKKAFRDRWLGRKNGVLTQINDLWLKGAPSEAKKNVGQIVNRIKQNVTQQVEGYLKFHDLAAIEVVGPSITVPFEELERLAKEHALAKQSVDVTLPGIHKPLGAEHPMLKTMNEVVGVFRNMGYSVAEGPEIETDYFNFEALNFPPNHPARDTQDTLFVAGQEKKPQRDRLLLRTHTSPVQIRAMLQTPPPIRVVAPGKVHRADTADATHSPIFHQVEGLAVDTNITFCDLKGTLDHAMKALFGSNVKTRFFPSFFPFTEPSADVSITCFKCGGKGCRLCKMSGWIELLGCGMVDPNVFKFVEHKGYDPEKISGFAFGMGVERITMLKYGIDDIQLFYQGDVRFLEQFA